jgi:hypothetical protein
VGTYTGALTSSGLPELAEEGEIDFPAMTPRRALHVTLRDSGGGAVDLGDPPGSEDRPAIVESPDGENFHVTVDNKQRLDLSRFPNGRLPVDTGLVLPAPLAPPAPVVIPKQRGLEFERDTVDVSGSAVDIASIPAIQPDLSRFPGRAMPVSLTAPPASLLTLEYEFGTAAATDFKLLDVDTGTRVCVVRASFTLSAACSVNALVRIGFGSDPTKTTLSTIGTVAGTPTSGQMILTHPKIAPGSGVIEGNGSNVIATGGSGCDMFLTCGASTGGKARVLVTYFLVAG